MQDNTLQMIDPDFDLLLKIIENSTGPVTAFFKNKEDVEAFQYESISSGQFISVKRVPYDYETQRGYTWQHQNSRDYELSV